MATKIASDATTAIYPTEFTSTPQPKGCCACCARIVACFSKLFAPSEITWHGAAPLSSSRVTYSVPNASTTVEIQRSESSEYYHSHHKLSVSYQETGVGPSPSPKGMERMEGLPNISQ